MKSDNLKRIAAIVIAFAVAFTMMPALDGTLASHAASLKKFSGAATGETSASLSWKKLSKKDRKRIKGLTVFRDGYAVSNIKKTAAGFNDTGLDPGTAYTYQIKSYTKKTKKTKMWYNKTTGQWQKKKPAKKYRGKSKTFRKTIYKYKKVSSPITVVTAASSETGGSSNEPSQSTRTQVNTVDYKGVSHTMWIDENGKYWTAATGGEKILCRAIYDKTVNATFYDPEAPEGFTPNVMFQRNGVTFKMVPMKGTDHYHSFIRVYNGDPNRVKIKIRNQTKAFKWKDGTYDNCVMSDDGEYRLTKYEMDAPNEIDFDPYEDVALYGHDGFVDGTVKMFVYYDFDNNGKYTCIGDMEREIKKNSARLKALEIAKAAVEYYGTNDYMNDMYAIKAYMYKNYRYGIGSLDGSGLDMRCRGGAGILETWSAYKYKVYGCIDDVGDSGHIGFYPIDNPYTKTMYFDAQGYGNYSDNPGTDAYNNTLRIYESWIEK